MYYECVCVCVCVEQEPISCVEKKNISRCRQKPRSQAAVVLLPRHILSTVVPRHFQPF